VTLVLGFVAGVLSTVFVLAVSVCLGAVWDRRANVTAYRGALRAADRPPRRM
jgi:hypothetical protein